MDFRWDRICPFGEKLVVRVWFYFGLFPLTFIVSYQVLTLQFVLWWLASCLLTCFNSRDGKEVENKIFALRHAQFFRILLLKKSSGALFCNFPYLWYCKIIITCPLASHFCSFPGCFSFIYWSKMPSTIQSICDEPCTGLHYFFQYFHAGIAFLTCRAFSIFFCFPRSTYKLLTNISHNSKWHSMSPLKGT